MKNFKIKRSMILCLVICFSLLTGCSGSSPKLSEDFNEEQVKTAAKDVIDMINSKDSEAILAISNDQMQEELTIDILNEVYKGIGEGEEFKSVEAVRVVGHEDKNSKEEFAVAIANAKYEKENFTYTITFDKQMKLAGLYFK